MRVVVVGGGIVGLATAWTLLRDRPDAQVVLLERESRIAMHQTGHNSGVVHAGLYYTPGSLNARLCRRGIGLMREFCAQRGIAYDACGKLVVATDARERERLDALAERATRNGVEGLAWVEGERMKAIEPNVQGLCALHSPGTAIVDFTAVARALAAAIESAGGDVRTEVGVARVRENRAAVAVEMSSGQQLTADRVVVCAGLESDRLARASGQSAEPRIIPFRGEYWKLRADRADLVRGLIYPVPNPALPFLGVHLTRKIDGEVWLGPNAVLALALDGYRWRDIRLRDARDIFGWPGTWRLMRRHWRVGTRELLSSRSKRRFIGEAQRFVPALRADDAVAASAGLRAQAVDRDGSLVDGLRIDRDGRVLWVRNAPSPAATSSLALAEELVGGL